MSPSIWQLIIVVAIMAFYIACFWKIWSKAGFNGAWSLLMLVPIANIVSIIYLAFAEWPIHKNRTDPSTFD